VVETVIETVVETVEVEKTSPYNFEILRQMAESGSYIGEPAEGHSIAFANVDDSLAYAGLVRQSVEKHWQLAGGTEDDLLLMDNGGDGDTALENAGAAMDAGVEVLIQFQLDPALNAVIGHDASRTDTYIIAVEIPVPGFPLAGVNNYAAGRLAGETAAAMIQELPGGWQGVDRILYLDASGSSCRTGLRTFGSRQHMIEVFGGKADDRSYDTRALMIEGVLTGGDAEKAIEEYLEDYPEDSTIAVFCLNDSVAQGVHRAASSMERWDPDSWILISHGLDQTGKELVRAGIIDAGISFFPDRYGEYLIPAALCHIYGNPVPAYIFIENAAVTAGNIQQYYPGEASS
jgi:ribose transport system substrate-binding protein